MGFIEGEGSFVVAKRSYSLIFNIYQSASDEPLMGEIQKFLNSLPPQCTDRRNPHESVGLSPGYPSTPVVVGDLMGGRLANVVSINKITKIGQPFDVLKLNIGSHDFILGSLIPFLDSLT